MTATVDALDAALHSSEPTLLLIGANATTLAPQHLLNEFKTLTVDPTQSEDDVVDFLIDVLMIPSSYPCVGVVQRKQPTTWICTGDAFPTNFLPQRPQQLQQNLQNNNKPTSCLRLFVSGSRSQVGKSSVCIGLLNSLLSLGYSPSEISYIKPATQCEEIQPVQIFCEEKGIDNVPVGPVVYFKGFTRSFLSGETETSDELLKSAAAAVDNLCSEGKQICVIDGVGYPSVGSITGTSNAAVAKACDASVILVGGKGVGDAVDTFNLNATFFESQGVNVIGGIFNRLPLTGYYSLENCKSAICSYFEQYKVKERSER